MKFIFSIFTLLLPNFLLGQNLSDLDKYSIDTVRLSSFSAKQLVVFTHNNLIFYLDYREYKSSVNDFINAYLKRDKNRISKANATLKSAKKQLRKSDTAYLTQQDFNNIGIQPMEKLFATQIDNNRCVIRDVNDFTHSIIIRVKGSFIKGPLNAWGGRRYYLLKQEKHFLLVTTSIS